jgi:hypothetical protein
MCHRVLKLKRDIQKREKDMGTNSEALRVSLSACATDTVDAQNAALP